MANRLRVNPSNDYQFRPRRSVLNERPPEGRVPAEKISIPKWVALLVVVVILGETIGLAWALARSSDNESTTSTTTSTSKQQTSQATIDQWFAVPEWGIGLSLPSDWSFLKREGSVVSLSVGEGESKDRATITAENISGSKTFEALIEEHGFTSAPVLTAPNHTPAVKAFEKEGWIHLVWKTDMWFDLAFPRTLGLDDTKLVAMVDSLMVSGAVPARDLVAVEKTTTGQSSIYRYSPDGKKRSILFTDADEALGIKTTPVQLSSGDLFILMGNRENDSINQWFKVSVDGQGKKTAVGGTDIGGVVQAAASYDGAMIAWVATDGAVHTFDLATKTRAPIPNISGAKSVGWYDNRSLLVRTTEGWKVFTLAGEAADEMAQRIVSAFPTQVSRWSWDATLKSFVSLNGQISVIAGTYRMEFSEPKSTSDLLWSADARSIGIVRDGTAGTASEIGILPLSSNVYTTIFTGNNRTKSVVGWLQGK